MHIPVLLNETIDGLNLKAGSIFLDGTLGGGGHSVAICQKFNGKIKIIGLDQDADAIARSKNRLKDCENYLFSENFRNMDKVLTSLKIEKVDGILLDLGLSSFQLEDSKRGFSFKNDEPLLMNMDKDGELTAYEVVNSWDEQSLEDIIFGYGEERWARKIAKRIVEMRKNKKIESSSQLAEIIKSAFPKSLQNGKTHPATKTFQAIRIAVNDELGALKEGLIKGFEFLINGGRMAVISFHSLEDRIVKNFFKEKNVEGSAKIITKKPIVPSREEIVNNPRSRSAKLRILEKV